MNASIHYTEPTIHPDWINTPAGLNKLINVLSNESLVAVDTESDSLYSYFEKVCLIQFSTQHNDYLVDPLAVDISDLAPFFADESIQKIFHAAEYDFLSLKRDYGFEFSNLFDTMLAARILGWSHYGLGSLLNKHFNLKLDKRFQRYNWGRRPLSKKALNYACLDTHYLIPLREIQIKALNEQNRLQEAVEAFERMTQVEPTIKTFDPDDFWRVKNSRELHPQEQAVLRELFILRDKIARKLDRPAFKVMNDASLVELARIQPLSLNALKQTKGLGSKLIQHNGLEILEAINQGQAAPPPKYPANHHHRPDDRILNRYELLRRWRNDLAASRGVEPDVIMNNHALMSIAQKNPRTMGTLTKIGVLGDWQRETYGQRLLQVLNGKA
ncbi:MAG: ribonuclease D [Anaerolineae bacterium]|nr:ribonuclease D [Anaerolineae bacterium]MCB0177494.1 ribonuclease D [Anaerolineae bacterium]MCB9105343.1 ribonuclease D [Anaerolineales bacterium]